MNTDFFIEMLNIDSTSGREREFADFLEKRMAGKGRRIEKFEVESMRNACPDGCSLPVNLYITWGTPKVVFCTHLDTVPPYIPPRIVTSPSSVIPGETGPYAGTVIHGRGSCDAKGQIFAMWEACLELERRGCTDFGLLLLAGEETGSFGAKVFSALHADAATGPCICVDKYGKDDRPPMPLRAGAESDWVIKQASSDAATGPGICPGKYGKDDRAPMPSRAVAPGDWVIIVGEPTDNFMTSASKGTKSFEVTFKGEAFHSGYPQYGCSAVEMFGDFLNALRSIVFPEDEILGETTWNIGRLVSDNPQNILSDRLTCRVYFRTTFESDEMVCNVMKNMAGPDARLRFGRRQVQDGSDIVAKDVAPWQVAMSVKAFGGDNPTEYETFEGFETKSVSFGSDAPQLTAIPHKILCGPGSILVAHRPDEHILMTDIEKAIKNYIQIAEKIL